MATGSDPALQVQGYVNSICTAVMLVCVVIILITTSLRSLKVITGRMPAMTLSEAEAQV
jgi:hypothetical protein